MGCVSVLQFSRGGFFASLKGYMTIPEAYDGALLADVALGLVLGGLGGSHTVQDG